MPGSTRRAERALFDKTRSRAVSAAIVAAGLVAVAAWLLSADVRRERRAASLAVGDGAARAEQLLGPPDATCPAGSLDHLGSEFPVDVPRGEAERVLERLRERTARRLLWGVDGCLPGDGDTEVGLDAEGRVAWVVPATGRRALQYPVPRR